MEGVTLDTIGGGALQELFDAELQRILANIVDPNTDTTSKRVITITVKFKPNRDRDVADVEIGCSSELAGIMSVSTQLFMGRQQGKLIAVESNPKQSELFDQERTPVNPLRERLRTERGLKATVAPAPDAGGLTGA